jgi:hypothetical protein
MSKKVENARSAPNEIFGDYKLGLGQWGEYVRREK